MSKTVICQVIALAASLCVTGCSGSMDNVRGSHHSMTDERPIEEKFSKISFEVPCKFAVHEGDKQSVKIVVDDNLLEHLHTDVVGDTLQVTRCAKWTDAGECRIEVTCPGVTAVTIAGAANGDVDKVTAKNFGVEVSGAGDVRAAGECDKVTVVIKGAGNVDLANVKCKNASVDMSGAGSTVVYPTDGLNATISGAGSVKYKGNPADVKKKISGVGSVVAI